MAITPSLYLFGVLLLFVVCPSLQDSCDQPLMLTPLLDKNETDKARQLSIVDKTFLEEFVPQSHAGYFTVNRTLGSHMFFWFFPSSSNARAPTPLLVWLNGGPALSSMLGLFHENGPMNMDKEQTTNKPKYHKRQHSWVGPFSVMYIDNPINTGFSYSEKDDGEDPLSEEKVSSNLFSVLEQFLKVFPEYRNVGLYIGGQSYAGMYTISLAHHIHARFETGKNDVTLTGIYLGGPFFDPVRQMANYGEFLRQIGSLSLKANADYMAHIVAPIFANKSSWMQRHSPSVNNIIHTLFQSRNFGLENNFASQSRVPYLLIERLMNTLDVKRAVHVGKNRKFVMIGEEKIREKSSSDPLLSRNEKLAVILDNYKVLVFNGDLDALTPTASIDAGLMRTPWKLQREYNETTRCVWKNNTQSRELAFYSYVGRFCRVIIRGAGHQTPYDRPETTLRIMEDFVTHGCVRAREDETVWDTTPDSHKILYELLEINTLRRQSEHHDAKLIDNNNNCNYNNSNIDDNDE